MAAVAEPAADCEERMRVASMGVPPRWVRVLVLAPLTWLGSLAVTLASPLLHLVLALLDLFDRRRWRFTRIGGMGIALCVTEFLGLTALFVLWVVSGFGLALRRPVFVRAHNRLFGWWLELVTRALCTFFSFEFVLPTTERIDGPVLTFARHAGPGDAFLLARTVIRDFRRQLRMVGTHKLLWDPFMSALMSRLPWHVCEPSPDPASSRLAIERLAASMGPDDVLIIFPEGGNWTPRRRDGSIERLRAGGRGDLADRATAMTHVLAPRAGGAAAALRAREDLAVVFVAHAGLEDLYSLGEIWRKVPLHRRVRAAYWSVPANSLPGSGEQVGEWLFTQWERVDGWIDAQPVS